MSRSTEDYSLPDFSKNCLSIRVIGRTACYDLNKPHFEQQGGRLFLVGTVPEGATDSGWSTGHTGAVAWDQVSDYVLFEDLHAYQKAVSKSEAYDEEQSKGD
ncbi:MAG: hypothetical protein AAGI88_13840 [Pseudomonadota bacterium]